MDGLNVSLQYVTGSTITVQNLENGKPGAEGFFATCQLLQKTTDHEVFRYNFTLCTYHWFLVLVSLFTAKLYFSFMVGV